MQQCLGPCGREVEQTNASGLCAICQQAQAKERTTDESSSSEVRACRRGCGQAVHRGSCKKNGAAVAVLPKRKYKRRAAAGPIFRGKVEAPGTAPDTQGARLREMRARMQEEYEQMGNEYARLQVKLEMFDEILGVLE